MSGELTITGGASSVEFSFSDGDVMVFPKGVLIAISDVSDRITFKLISSRKTVCSWANDDITDSEATAAETVEALNEIL